MKNYPTYVSKACAKSLWNEYRVYEDRVELEFRLFFKTFVISYEDMISIAIFDPPVIKTKFWALKLDWADFNQHVGIVRKNGFMKHLRFIPQEPDKFVAAVGQYLKDLKGSGRNRHRASTLSGKLAPDIFTRICPIFVLSRSRLLPRHNSTFPFHEVVPPASVQSFLDISTSIYKNHFYTLRVR